MSGTIIGLIIAAVVVIMILWVIASYNGFIKRRNKIDEAFATMDVYMKKRRDLVPNLVETVKGYAAHESGTLEQVIAARNMAASATATEDKIKAENQLTSTLKSLFAVSENYPDLKANQNFMALQSQLTSLEDDIANSRKYYNAVVRDYNTAIQVFPRNIISGIGHFEKKPMFEASDTDRQNVEVKF